MGSRLLNIHGQHDGQQLLDEEQHLLYLDSFGRTEPLLTAYREKYAKLTDIRRQMHALQMDEAEKARRMDTLRYQIQELQRAKLRPGEEELTSRRNLLRNGEKFMSAVSRQTSASAATTAPAALALLRQAQSALEPSPSGQQLRGLYQRLEAVYSEVYDLAYHRAGQAGRLRLLPQELDEVEGRLDQLYRLKKSMAGCREYAGLSGPQHQELDAIEDAGDTLLHLQQLEKKKALSAAQSAAEELQGPAIRRPGSLEQILTELLLQLPSG